MFSLEERKQNIRDMALVVSMAAQPQVGREFFLLCQFDQSGLKLDLYGEMPRAAGDSYNVTDACLSGTTVSLYELLSAEQLRSFTDYCERHLPDGAALAEQSRCEAQEWLGVGA